MERTRAWALLTEHTQGRNLINHALAVEAAMRAYARRLDGDEDRWGVTGLLHDFDYERWPEPENHPQKGAEILRSAGCDAEIVDAILSHAQYLGLERKSPMDRALFAVDELCGLITAVALVRPSRSVVDVKLSSVKKKWKQRAFAEGVNREDIEAGARELGVDLDEHIQVVLDALKGVAADIGLAGDKDEDEKSAAA